MAKTDNQRLNATVTIGGALSQSFRGAITSSRKQIGRVGDAIGQLKDRQRRLGRVADHWEKQGRSAQRYREELERVENQLGQLRKAQDNVGRIRNAQQANIAKRERLRGQMFDAVAIGATAAAPIAAAVRFESTMADLNKVADLTPKRLGEVRKQILGMSRELPMAADQIGAIMTAAAQSGVADDEMAGFTRSAIKMGVAMDITGDQAGTMMAKWRTGMDLTQPQVVALADATNHLSNNMAATAPEIAQVVASIGSYTQTAGIGEKQTAALAASMIAAGGKPDKVATGIKRMASNLTAGESATSSQADAMARLGITASDMAERMQQDAAGTIELVLRRIKALDEAERPAVIKELFGQESVGVIAPLLSNLQALTNANRMAADSQAYLGSMQEEYEARAKTTANNLQLLQNKVMAVGITLGSVLLPAVNDVAHGIGAVADVVADVADRFPVATKVVVGTTVALAGLKIASIAGGYAFTFLRGGALSLIGVLYRTQAATAAATAGTTAATAGPTLLGRAFLATGRNAKNALTRIGNLVQGTIKAPFRAAVSGPRILGRALVSLGSRALAAGGNVAALATSVARNPLGAALAGPRMLGRALLGVGRGARSATLSMRALTVATVTNPIGAAVTAIAVGALLIYRYWKPIKAFFQGLWSGFESAAGPVGAAMDQIVDALGPVGDAFKWVGGWIKKGIGWFGSLLEPVDTSEKKLRSFQSTGEAVGKAIGQAFASMARGVAKWIKWVVDKVQWVGNAFNEAKSWLGFGGDDKEKLDLSDAPTGGMKVGDGQRRRPIYQPGGDGQRGGPPVPLRRNATVNDNSTHTTHVTINQQPGEDGESVAQRAADEVEKRRRERERTALYDQGPSYGY